MLELNAISIAFAVFSIIALGGALGVVTNKNLFRGTVWLMVSLFGVAGLFVLLSAPFLAAIQILVYIGAIAILFTFAVMLTRGLTQLRERFNRLVPNLVVSVILFGVLIFGVIWPVWGAADAPLRPDLAIVEAAAVVRTVDLGVELVAGDGLVLPFEVVSLLLTAAMIGAIVIARDEEEAR